MEEPLLARGTSLFYPAMGTYSWFYLMGYNYVILYLR